MNPIVRRFRRAGGTLAAIVLIVFVAQVAAMGVLSLAGLLEFRWRCALLGGAVLSLLASGPIYGLMLLPIHREHDRRLAAERRARELDRLAMTDPLTGVLNRRGVLARLLEAAAHAERYDRHLSLAMLDLDRFKQVNDDHGHAFGDRVLERVVGRIVGRLRASDLIGRVGGDEFLLVLPETELDLTVSLAERIRQAVDGRRIDVDGTAVRLGVSIGASELRKGERLADLLERVDRALYEAKATEREGANGAVRAIPV